jgi:hypothetical protein
MTSGQIMENWRREQEPPSEVQGPDDPRGVWLAAPFGLFAALQLRFPRRGGISRGSAGASWSWSSWPSRI